MRSREGFSPSPEKQKSLKLGRIIKTLRNIALGVSILSGSEVTQAQELRVTHFGETKEPTPSQEQRTKRLEELFGDNLAGLESYGFRHETNPDGSLGKIIERNRAEVEKEAHDDQPSQLETIRGKDGAITAEIMAQLVETYPKNWVQHEVNYIGQRSDHKYEDSKKFGIFKVSEVVAVAIPSEDGKTSINFTKFSEKLPVKAQVETLSHELGHANDFREDDDLSVEEMLDLMLTLGQRIVEKDRFKSYYVEHINDKNPQDQNYTRATEYWAEVSAQYFEDRSKLNFKDVLLVERVIQKNDPNFDWQKAKQRRDELIRQAKGKR